MVFSLLTTRTGPRYASARYLVIGGTLVDRILRVKIRISSLVLRMFIITTSILRNSIGSIAWIGIIRDRGIGVVSRYRRELQLQHIWRARLYTLRNAHLLACCVVNNKVEGILPLLLPYCLLFSTRLPSP